MEEKEGEGRGLPPLYLSSGYGLEVAAEGRLAPVAYKKTV